MWKVIETPANYKPSGGEQWCIIDVNDGDVFNFYFTKEEAEHELMELSEGVAA